jgi:hypothetical protein
LRIRQAAPLVSNHLEISPGGRALLAWTATQGRLLVFRNTVNQLCIEGIATPHVYALVERENVLAHLSKGGGVLYLDAGFVQETCRSTGISRAEAGCY